MGSFPFNTYERGQEIKSSGKLLCVIRLIGRSFIPFSFIVMLLSASVVHAIPIQVNFTAQGFAGFFPSPVPPTDPVTGTIIYEVSSPTATIDSLTSINLTIHGHTYLISEVGYFSLMGIGQMIGGTLSGVHTNTIKTDDFIIRWEQSTLIPLSFGYTSTLEWNIWSTSKFSQFSVTASATPIPEPATMLLLGSGLVGLVGYGRKKFFNK